MGVWLGVFAPRSTRRARLEQRFVLALHDYQRQRWERPVLRGVPIEGNALDAQVEAMRDLPPIDASYFEDLHALLARSSAPPPELAALLARSEPALARYRASTQRTWAWRDAHPERGLAGLGDDWLPHVRAGRLLLVSALGRTPGECLAICADVLRLAQDRAAGTGLVPLMILAAHAEDVLVLGARCIGEADRAALEEAARELAMLAAHPAPTGSALEVEALVMGAALRDAMGSGSSLAPSDSWIDRARYSWDTLEAWELLMGEPASRRTIGDDYPADIDRMRRWQADIAARDNALIDMAATDYARFLARDAVTRAIVRLLLIAARVRLAHDAPPDAAPALLADPELLDPTSGHPFTWAREGPQATIASRTSGALQHGELALTLSWPDQ